LRDQVLDGFDNDILGFIRILKVEYPPAAAALIAKLLPPASDERLPEAGRVINFTINSVQSGVHFASDELETQPGLHLVIDGAGKPIVDG
jgi:hypothetical protein